ncbi:MAG: DNA-directed RNA polymerase subunit alpha [Candidatus Phytoplasma stylosanthis]|uniref:DNA-directed RNA polymerase subunit alpha n=1 Tax=Candidatus Phytoplasma stylosanthis TaxID=2798314 RepID=UPI002939E4C9|nr:DNA-directed RNA polymerase subunit alpha [Candidatus Phytoplasma stylosanthis]MDV3167864.1 DNA-directed RNA polymerase subunit alpha [Candidatus Phytoplasma stylosanthis]MDV3170860.1 DNA-directed RNA polymerase subunit alpha [Candidatus Phytoplasma stylosanthis]MDV3173514.1 DNA-directed RNA polymerase subunit alpha [Candidatus Phytoplasma stylosanthis]MDV3174040.1 DNA-directed RNA polymerase subunit alpha [Candidatus Phytoplasma stylosanthis]MDV3196380.1 DNA-directed RNA polymerase subunit
MQKLKFIKPNMLIEQEGTDSFLSKFRIYPLERGLGITIGNSLRRVLLSSLPGVAIVNTKIEGVNHYFSVIPGVLEDVMSIVLNLKKVVISVDSEEEDFETELKIDTVGEKVVTAADFNLVDGVKIINKDQIIATLTKDTLFQMKVTVKKGIGYASSEDNKIYSKNEFGVIPIDSLYTPIVRVTYNVEPKLNSKEELVIEIETNKSISSKEALSTASKILIDHFNVLVNLSEKAKNNFFIYEPKKESHSHALNLRIDQLGISVRLFNSLKKSGINTVKELVDKNEKYITKLNSLGKKSLEELKNKMKELEINFQDDIFIN